MATDATVLVTSRSFSDGDEDLDARARDAGIAIVRGPSHHDLAALAPLLADADGWIAGTGPVTAEHLDAAPRLRVLARYGVGVEAVDLEAATARGIQVTNTPGANAEAVADHTVGLMLAALRHTVDGDRRVRSGDWSVRRGRELGALTVAIVGFGRIGQGVARRLAGFGTRIIAVDPYTPKERAEDLGVELLPLPKALSKADLVSLHAPGGEVIIGADTLAQLQPGVVIVNAARADLVDEDALADALRDGRVAAYAADMVRGDTAGEASVLLDDALSDRVTITPHLGAQTVQAIDNMGGAALAETIAILSGGSPSHPVNTLPATPGASAEGERA